MASLSTTLKNGKKIPTIGYGCYQVTGSLAVETFLTAARAGYRHFDSASFYRNEVEVGTALRQFMAESGTSRADMFYTTKAWTTEQGDKLSLHVDEALERCGLGYIDLMLLHWPANDRATRETSWRVLAQAVKDGKLKSAGVSNYSRAQIEEINDLRTGVEPVVNQIEISPWTQDKELIEYCQSQEIVLQAYCPLARARNMEDEKLVGVARKYGKTPAQVLVRWSVQRGFVPLPKSSNPERMEKNLNVGDFTLQDSDMDLLNRFA